MQTARSHRTASFADVLKLCRPPSPLIHCLDVMCALRGLLQGDPAPLLCLTLLEHVWRIPGAGLARSAGEGGGNAGLVLRRGGPPLVLPSCLCQRRLAVCRTSSGRRIASAWSCARMIGACSSGLGVAVSIGDRARTPLQMLLAVGPASAPGQGCRPWDSSADSSQSEPLIVPLAVGAVGA